MLNNKGMQLMCCLVLNGFIYTCVMELLVMGDIPDDWFNNRNTEIATQFLY